MLKIRQTWDEVLALPKKSKLGITGLLFSALIFGFIIAIFYWRINP